MTSFLFGQAKKQFSKGSEFFGDNPSDVQAERPSEFYDTYNPNKARIAVLNGGSASAGGSSSAAFIEFDAMVTSEHDTKAEPTKHPVEGATVTDHIMLPPEELTLRVIVSDFPLEVRRFGGGQSDGFGYDAATDERDPVVSGGDKRDRSNDAYRWLLDIRNKRFLLEVYTPTRTYTNMAITRISRSVDKDTGHIADLKLSFQEIPIAVTETVPVKSTTRPAVVAKGKKTKTAATPAVEKKKSALIKAIDYSVGQ